MSRQSAECLLFAQEPSPLLVGYLRGQYLHCHMTVERTLDTLEDDTETTAADLASIIEAGRRRFCCDTELQVA